MHNVCIYILYMFLQDILFFSFVLIFFSFLFKMFCFLCFLCSVFLVQTQVEPVKNLTKLNSGTTQKPQAWKSLKILKPAWKCPSKIQNRPAQNSIVLFCFCNVLAN